MIGIVITRNHEHVVRLFSVNDVVTFFKIRKKYGMFVYTNDIADEKVRMDAIMEMLDSGLRPDHSRYYSKCKVRILDAPRCSECKLLSSKKCDIRKGTCMFLEG